MPNTISQLKFELEKEILNMVFSKNEIIKLIDLKYFSPKVRDILKIAKHTYDEKEEKIDIVAYHMKASEYGIEFLDNVYTLKEFENVYKKIKDFYNAENLKIRLERETLTFLNTKSFDYEKALLNLRGIAENLEMESSKIKPFDKVIEDTKILLKDYRQGISGYKTELPTLDRKLKGLKKGQYIIIAGRTHMGKTTFALWLTYNLIKQGAKVLYFAFEQPAARLLSSIIGIYKKKFFAEVTDDDINDFEKKFQKDKPIHFIDDPMNIYDVKFEVELAKIKYGTDVVVVDHIGLIKNHTTKLKKHEILSIISKELKSIAMNGFIVITLAQINREVEKAANKIPTLAMLRDSGALEEDADTILALYREGYYNKKADENKMLIRILKNRDIGETGDISTVMENYNIYEVIEEYENVAADIIPF